MRSNFLKKRKKKRRGIRLTSNFSKLTKNARQQVIRIYKNTEQQKYLMKK